MFKLYQIEVEKQLDNKIKVVRSDREGVFYRKYDGTGQHNGPFTTYLEECGIVA